MIAWLGKKGDANQISKQTIKIVLEASCFSLQLAIFLLKVFNIGGKNAKRK